jgi:[histone H3]-lysine36 N-trimethyltransferase
VGFIGGKTQTDLGGMDDLYIDGKSHRPPALKPASENPLALGIADEVERLGLKGNRRKKGKKLDEDFNVNITSFFLCSPLNPSQPVLKPMEEDDVPKVVNAIRQTTSRSILTKLIERIKVCKHKIQGQVTDAPR